MAEAWNHEMLNVLYGTQFTYVLNHGSEVCDYLKKAAGCKVSSGSFYPTISIFLRNLNKLKNQMPFHKSSETKIKKERKKERF